MPADPSLIQARKQVVQNEESGYQDNSQGDQIYPKTETHKKKKVKKDREGKPLANKESFLPDQKSATPQPPQPCGGESAGAEQSVEMELPTYDRLSAEDMAQQQRTPGEDVASPRVSRDGFDPDQGLTEYTPEPSLADDHKIYDEGDYDPPFCNDFHDSHLEVHREFWDIIDAYHQCDFCRRFCTVMRCPSCDAQACSYCKDTYG